MEPKREDGPVGGNPAGETARTPENQHIRWSLETDAPTEHQSSSTGSSSSPPPPPHRSVQAPADSKVRNGPHHLHVLIRTLEEKDDAVLAAKTTAKKSGTAKALGLLPPSTSSSTHSTRPRAKSDPAIGRRSLSKLRSSKGRGHSQNRSSNSGDGAKFEKHLFRNATVLCDVQAMLVEYAQENPDEPDPRYNVTMVPACQEARICVIRKREHREFGGTKLVTSVWSLSHSGKIRLQHKLSDAQETVPYCSYFNSKKVSLQSTDAPVLLKFHGELWGHSLQDEIKTNWVNYCFTSEDDAVAFQSAVFDRTLIGSFHTTKTTVVREGLKGAFPSKEQFANIEVLRLWEDDGTSIPGTSGGVLALMHMSSNFGDGWARWWINNSERQVKIKGEGSKYVKVKGVNITVVPPGKNPSTTFITGEAPQPAPWQQKLDLSMRGSAFKRVNGIKIEFRTEKERDLFYHAAKKAQTRCFPLPDL